VRDFGQLWTSIANFSGTDRGIDKWKTTLSTTIPPALRKKLVNFGPLTRKFTCLISTHPRLPLRVLCWLMRLHSGHVTLPGAEFQPPKLSPHTDLLMRHFGLCPKFLVYNKVRNALYEKKLKTFISDNYN